MRSAVRTRASRSATRARARTGARDRFDIRAMDSHDSRLSEGGIVCFSIEEESVPEETALLKAAAVAAAIASEIVSRGQIYAP